MKTAAKAQRHLPAEIMEESVDVIPPDEGIFSVDYDFHLLDSGFTVEMFNVDTSTYTCIPNDYQRCRIVASDVQHDELISSTVARAKCERAESQGLGPVMAAATAQPTMYAAPATTQKEEPKIRGLPDNIDPTKPPKNFKDAKSRVDRDEWMAAYSKEYQGMMDS
jgi:hypothetical protein